MCYKIYFFSFSYISIKLCLCSSLIAVYFRKKNDFATVVMEQFMGLTYSDNRERTWKASPQRVAAKLSNWCQQKKKSTSPVKTWQVSTYSAYTALWITLVLSLQGPKQMEFNVFLNAKTMKKEYEYYGNYLMELQYGMRCQCCVTRYKHNHI